MSLLKLNNIGKIYVSENNVTVGIRDVNLSFDRGEFVAITGKSGAGKSTLLNVISGMDSYEEGELFVEGKPTSHYLQPDWEEYRKKYISFIFQDYNIIESFTVLENVELALMHIEDKKERKKRALELIDRVGLSSHLKHKGSKLSGGQKQRTVIARALAKDSPIILADEPTGNLDSATSKEIIDLLRRVSQDKLVIVVTHNFDDFASCATRHIRVHDGAVEFDHSIKEAKIFEEAVSENNEEKKEGKKEFLDSLKNGLSLGFSIFKSKPRLTVFLCILMIIGTLGVFGVTALCGNAWDIFEPMYMFTHIDGRLVVTTQSGKPLEKDEIAELATKYGAESYLQFDSLLDTGLNRTELYIPYSNGLSDFQHVAVDFTFNEDFGNKIIGRYPEANNEVFLYLPIYYKEIFGNDDVLQKEVALNTLPLSVVGVKYYYDNNLTPRCMFTEDGFKVATAATYLYYSNLDILTNIDYSNSSQRDDAFLLQSIIPSFDLDADKVYISSPRYESAVASEQSFNVSVSFGATYNKYNNYAGAGNNVVMYNRNFENKEIERTKPNLHETVAAFENSLVVSDEILVEMAYAMLADSYRQASLFFKDDKAAAEAAELINKEGYIAVPSNTTYEENAETAIFSTIGTVATAAIWFFAVVFLAFFINLCSLRAIQSFKGDLATMRSMGIKVRVIKIGIYIRMVLCLIPAFALLLASSVLIYTSAFNQFFTYLYFWQYALIVIGMIILTVRTTKKQIFRLFSESVKKSLKGGSDQ